MDDSLTEKQLKLDAIELVSGLATTTPTELERAKITQWRKQSTQHDKAWLEAENAWNLMAELDADELAVEDVKAAKVIKLPQWQFYRIPAGIAASLLFMWFLVFPVPQLETNASINVAFAEQNKVENYSNQRREQYKVTLTDGSIVHLNYNSSIQVSFSSDRRNVELIQGEAFFEVTKNPDRPFIVKAGETTATAVGTAFVVRRQGEEITQVTVTEGLVAVALLEDEDSVMLAINETVTSENKLLSTVQKIDAGNTAAWHRGVLVFRDISLADTLAEIGRYTPYRIEANFEDWPNDQVTGTFFINRLDEDLGTLISRFNLVVVNNRNGVLELGLPSPQRPSLP